MSFKSFFAKLLPKQPAIGVVDKPKRGRPKGSKNFAKVRRTPRQCKTQQAYIDRAADIVRRFTAGDTLDAIGNVYNITRERVRQILWKEGLVGKDGGYSIIAADNKAIREMEKTRRLDDRRMHIYGCGIDEFTRLNNGVQKTRSGKRSLAYMYQRRTSMSRGIGWQLTFAEWCKVWEESGHEHERGRGPNMYGMARISNKFPYCVDNIKIVTCSQASSESYAYNPMADRVLVRNHNRPTRPVQVLELIRAGKDTVDEVAVALGIKPYLASAYLVAARRKLNGST